MCLLGNSLENIRKAGYRISISINTNGQYTVTSLDCRFFKLVASSLEDLVTHLDEMVEFIHKREIVTAMEVLGNKRKYPELIKDLFTLMKEKKGVISSVVEHCKDFQLYMSDYKVWRYKDCIRVSFQYSTESAFRFGFRLQAEFKQNSNELFVLSSLIKELDMRRDR